MTELMRRRRALMGAQEVDDKMKWLENVSGIGGFSLNNQTISDSIVLDFGQKPVSGFSMSKVTIEKDDTVVEIKCGNLAFAPTALNSQNKTTKPWTLKLSCANTPSFDVSEFTRSGTVTRIIGKPGTISQFGTGGYARFNSTKLVEVYFVPNCIATGGPFTTGELIDASLVSFANALQGGLATQQTVTIGNAATKDKCNTIVGTVSTVTEGGSTYDFFTQDPSGTVTLYDFITQTKGWLIA